MELLLPLINLNIDIGCDKKCLKISSKLVYLHLVVVSGGEHVDVVIGAAVADGKVTPKVQSLIKILLRYQHTEDFRAIIFVERVVAALVLPKVKICSLSTVLFFFSSDSS